MAAEITQRDIDIVMHRSDMQFEYQDGASNMNEYPLIGQGPAVLANASDLERDELGFTNPNLHRRIDPQDPPIAEDPRNQEAFPRSYQLDIQNVYSYRTTSINVHNEESIDNETP